MDVIASNVRRRAIGSGRGAETHLKDQTEGGGISREHAQGRLPPRRLERFLQPGDHRLADPHALGERPLGEAAPLSLFDQLQHGANGQDPLVVGRTLLGGIILVGSPSHSTGVMGDRDWSRQARPQILSIIDSVATDRVQDGKVPVGGIAWAGDRGIQKVEVQVDAGPWAEAVLRTPPLSSRTWVQWVYDWPRQGGRHTFRVRATDGTGALQIETSHDPSPNGATGYHSVTRTLY